MRDLQVLSAVRTALRQGRPVVALESTVITHGLPYPHNLAVARRMEERVRAGGAVPATIAVRQGRLAIGLSDGDLADLAQATAVRIRTSSPRNRMFSPSSAACRRALACN